MLPLNFPSPLRIARGAAVLALVLAGTALAQEPEKPPPVGEIAWLRGRYGVALRNGLQTDIGPGMNYTGLTPNDVALDGAWYPGAGYFGLALSAQREAFALMDPATRQTVVGGSLYRGELNGAARFAFGAFRIDGLVGYGLAQVPSFGNSAAPQFGAVTRHGLVFGARMLVDLPWDLRFEARGEYPLGLFATAGGQPARASGYAGGAAIIWNAGAVGTMTYALVFDYQYVHDEMTVGTQIAGQQTLSRAGLSFELAFLEKPPPPKYGNVRVRVVDADTGAPVPSPKVVLASGGGNRSLDESGGVFLARNVDPGDAVAKATAGGYIPAEGKVVVVAGKDSELEVRAKKEPPKVGALSIVLVDRTTAGPVANATVKVRGQEYVTGPGGNIVVKDLQPGPVAVAVTANGYRPMNEVASVVVYKTSSLPLTMTRLAAKLPATITGTVRNIVGGAPVAATLEIPQAKVKTLANKAGTFMIRVEGGTYTVNISAPGFKAQSKQVTVKDGDQAIFNVDLHPGRR